MLRVISKRRSSQAVVRVGLISRRDAILTPVPTAFETSYYDYRSAIDREHSRPFQKEFYFKKGTSPELAWDNAVSQMEKKTVPLGGLARLDSLQSEEMKRLVLQEYTENGNIE